MTHSEEDRSEVQELLELLHLSDLKYGPLKLCLDSPHKIATLRFHRPVPEPGSLQERRAQYETFVSGPQRTLKRQIEVRIRLGDRDVEPFVNEPCIYFNKHHARNQHQCTVCLDWFPTSKEKHHHKHCQPVPDGWTESCDDCGCPILDSIQADEHCGNCPAFKTHVVGVHVQCGECLGWHLLGTQDLDEHHSECTGRPVWDDHQCPTCGAGFLWAEYLKRHIGRGCLAFSNDNMRYYRTTALDAVFGWTR